MTDWLDDPNDVPWEEFSMRERYDDMGPAPTLSEAHSHWHAVHGWDKVCDLDCGATEGLYDMDQDELFDDSFDDDAAEYWQTYGEPEAREEMSAQEYNLFEFGVEPPF